MHPLIDESQTSRVQNFTIVWIIALSHHLSSFVHRVCERLSEINQEADGCPTDVGEDLDKCSGYVFNYLQPEWVQLDPDKIEKNPGGRSTAKMMLNSFGGKFEKQPSKSQVQTFKSSTKFYKLLQVKEQDTNSIRIVNDELIKVVHSYCNKSITTQMNINILWCVLPHVVPISTLWSLETLETTSDVLRHGLSHLPLETDHTRITPLESTSDNSQMNQMILTITSQNLLPLAQKNYSYRTVQGKMQYKVWRFSLNTWEKQQLNFAILENIHEIKNPQPDPNSIPVFNPHKIVKDNTSKQCFMHTEIKRYQLVWQTSSGPPQILIVPISIQGCPGNHFRLATTTTPLTTIGSLWIDDFPEDDDVSTLEVVYAHALPDVALFRVSSWKRRWL